jgi:simple sugar transport system substrate-binding protein
VRKQKPGHTLAWLVFALLWSACTRTAPPAGANARDSIRIVVVTHGQSSDPFWSVVSNGVRAAASELGVRAEYQAPSRFDMIEMSNLIDAVVATRPTGLVVSIPDPAALGASIRRAVAAGIPVISINSGADVSASLGALVHVGQTEYDAGVGAGERMSAAGVKHALCVNQEVGNTALDQRCRGFADAMTKAGGKARVLAVDLANPDDAQQRIAGALRSDASVDGVLSLGPTGAEPALAAVLQDGNSARVRFATFDLSPHVLEAIRDGQALFAIDQQQYLQGYLPVVFLTKYHETLAVPGGGHVILTGPGFVTRDNAARVIELSRRGIR